MELAFSEKHLRDICEKQAKAVKMYGEEVAGRLRRRLADFRAAEILGDVVAGRPEEKDGEVYFQLGSNYALALSVNDLEWRTATRVKILRIFKK